MNVLYARVNQWVHENHDRKLRESAEAERAKHTNANPGASSALSVPMSPDMSRMSSVNGVQVPLSPAHGANRKAGASAMQDVPFNTTAGAASPKAAMRAGEDADHLYDVHGSPADGPFSPARKHSAKAQQKYSARSKQRAMSGVSQVGMALGGSHTPLA